MTDKILEKTRNSQINTRKRVMTVKISVFKVYIIKI